MRPNASVVSESGILAGTITPIACTRGAWDHQIKINKDSASTGTIALTAKSAGSDTSEIVYDAFGAAIVFNAASTVPQTYILSGVFDSFTLTPTALNGTYKYSYSAR